MPRWLSIHLSVFMPFQFSWATMTAYCEHESGARAQHFGHHEHQHQHQQPAGESSEAFKVKLVPALDVADCRFHCQCSVVRRELEAAEGSVLQGSARPNPELSFLLEDTQRATRTTTLQINQPIVELARRAADAAGKRVRAGKVSPVEETRARVTEATARLEAAQAASALRLSRQRLAATWGDAVPRFERVSVAPFDQVKSTDYLAPVLTLDALSARLAASPSPRRAQLEVQRRSALSDLERFMRTPDLTVSLG